MRLLGVMGPSVLLLRVAVSSYVILRQCNTVGGCNYRRRLSGVRTRTPMNNDLVKTLGTGLA